jgi:hypothetical protein
MHNFSFISYDIWGMTPSRIVFDNGPSV